MDENKKQLFFEMIEEYLREKEQANKLKESLEDMLQRVFNSVLDGRERIAKERACKARINNALLEALVTTQTDSISKNLNQKIKPNEKLGRVLTAVYKNVSEAISKLPGDSIKKHLQEVLRNAVLTVYDDFKEQISVDDRIAEFERVYGGSDLKNHPSKYPSKNDKKTKSSEKNKSGEKAND